MQTSTTQTVTKQQCDTCSREVEVHSEITYPVSDGRQTYYSTGVYKETYRYPAENVAPRFFRVQINADSHAPLYLELCGECVRELVRNKYGAPNAKPQEWFEEVMEELRPSESSKPEEFGPFNDKPDLRPDMVDEAEPEIYYSAGTSDPGSDGDPGSI